jgi:hypothetical protein
MEMYILENSKREKCMAKGNFRVKNLFIKVNFLKESFLDKALMKMF